MFIIDQCGKKILEVKTAELYFNCSKQMKEKVREKFVSKFGTPYPSYHLPEIELEKNIREYEEEIQKKVDDYLYGQKLFEILINGTEVFGRYNKVQGEFVFENIITALKNGEYFLDMREIDYATEEQK